jgi:hypothetical protein
MYQQLGLVVEDALVTLVSWSIWANDKSQNLAEIVAKVSLKSDKDSQPYTAVEIGRIVESSRGNRRLLLDGRRYLDGLLSGVSRQDVPRLLGIPWKPNPSVRLVPREHRENWTVLPDLIRQSISAITDRNDEAMTACFNKLKHGPQLVVDDARQAALRRGHSQSNVERLPKGERLRLLMAGSRCEMWAEEIDKGKLVAPFLLDEPSNAKRLLNMVGAKTALSLSMFGRWLYRSTYAEEVVPEIPSDARLHAVMHDLLAHFGRIRHRLRPEA